MAGKKNEIVSNIRDAEKAALKKHRSVLPWVFSLLCAFALWFYVMAVESPVNEKTFYSIPITIEQGNGDLSLYSGYNSTVDVTVSGKKSDINQLSADNFSASADISNCREAGKYSVPVTINLPEKTSLVDSSITTLSVYLDVKSTAKIPVVVELTDYILEDTLELAAQSDIDKSVSEITLTGPLSVLDTIEAARVSIPCGQITSSIRASGTVSLIDKDGTVITNPYITMDTNEVEVKVPVYMTKDINLKVDFKNGYLNDSNSDVSINPSSVKVKGTVEALSSMKDCVISTIDEKTLTSDHITVPIKLPEGITSVEGIENAEVNITHIGTVTKTLSVSKINVSNPDGLSYRLSADSVNITLRGDRTILSSITSDNISLEADLSNQSAGAGDIKLPLSVVIAPTYSNNVYELGEYNIVVTVY